MRSIQYLISRIGLFAFFATITFPIIALLVWSFQFIEEHDDYKILLWVVLPIGFIYIIGLPWLAHTTAKQMVFEDQTLGVALKSTFYDLRMLLAFLPLVGRWLHPRPEKHKPYEHDDG